MSSVRGRRSPKRLGPREWIIAALLLACAAMSSMALFTAIGTYVVGYPFRKSFYIAAVLGLPVMSIAVPAVLIGMTTPFEGLFKDPRFLTLLELIRLGIRCALAAVLAFIAPGLLAGGSILAGVAAAAGALAVSMYALRRFRMRALKGRRDGEGAR